MWPLRTTSDSGIPMGRRTAVFGFAALAMVAGSLGWWFSVDHASPETLLAEARRARGWHDKRCEELALRVWKISHSDEAALLAAESAAHQHAWPRMLEHFGRIRSNNPNLQISTRLRLAQILHNNAHRLGQAERAYRRVLELDPDHVAANTGLAQVLSTCGRMR